jgi:hypothetical protein
MPTLVAGGKSDSAAERGADTATSDDYQGLTTHYLFCAIPCGIKVPESHRSGSHPSGPQIS